MEPQPEPKKQTAIEFAKAKLGLNPEASFAEIKAQAKIEGLVIYPVVYGRAKALMGLVPTAPYGSKSKARKAEREALAAASRPAMTEPQPPAPVAPINGSSTRTVRARASAVGAESGPISALESMITDLKTAVLERDRYRVLLQKIAEMIQAELAR